MNEQQRGRLWIPLFWGTLIVGFIATVLAIALRNLPLMLLALALPALAGIGLFSVIQRGRPPGRSRSWPPPGTRI
jgi:hypothetical protein